jgi:RimJ/RimL family protein N-acetyltransferase
VRDIFPFPYTQKDAEFFLKHIANNPANLILAIDVNGEAIGSIGVHFKSDVYRNNAELGYWLSEQFWGKGIITEAVKALIKYVFENYHIKRIYACVFQNNTASIRVLEKCGFLREAVHKNAIIKKGVIMDEYIYTKFAED